MNVKEAQQFVADFSKGEYDPEEHAAFLQWVRKASVGELEIVADEHEANQGQWVISAQGPSPEWVSALEDRLDRLAVNRKVSPVVVMPFGKKVLSMVLKPWIAAASITALIVAGAIVYNQPGGSLKTDVRKQSIATLTQAASVARGGAVSSITLPDGSKVWLNFASTLKYPPKFSGSERVVELSGEGYFEVSQRADMPFRVLIKDAEVKVLGTHFNIMAYDDEPVSRISLIDGSVSVESGSQGVTLHPGQQGEIPYPSPGAMGPIKVIPGIDPSAIVAWKDGNLKFESADGLRHMMRMLARCYDVEIQVDQNVPDEGISGAFFRRDGLAYILKRLEVQEHLHTIYNGKTVSITLAK